MERLRSTRTGERADDAPLRAPSDRDQLANESMQTWVTTIPNVICLCRMCAAPLLLVLSWADSAVATTVLFVLLAGTDWIDGKLARLLDQRSKIGPRLDSIADASMYGCLALSLVILRGAELADEVVWVAVATISYIAACVFSLVKFKRLPSYHARSAKISWLLVGITAVILLLGGPTWMLRIAMVSVTVANLESAVLTYLLKEPRTDIKSAWYLIKQESD